MSSATSQFVRVNNGWGYTAEASGHDLYIVIDPNAFNTRGLGRLVHQHSGRYQSVTLDLSAFTAVDSVILGHLLELRRSYQERGVDRFLMVNVKPRVAELLHLLRVDTCFQLRAA